MNRIGALLLIGGILIYGVMGIQYFHSLVQVANEVNMDCPEVSE